MVRVRMGEDDDVEAVQTAVSEEGQDDVASAALALPRRIAAAGIDHHRAA